MEIHLIISFIVASVLLTLMPGPDILFVISQSITNGARAGISIAIGLVLGVVVHTFLAATGVTLIITQSALAFTILKYTGAAYLLYLAIMAIKEKAKLDYTNQHSNITQNWKRDIRTGFLMNVLNPKVSLFFIAFLPQFVSPIGYPKALQMMVLGLIFMIQAIIVFSSVALLAGSFTSWLSNDRFFLYTKWIKVSVLFTLIFLLLI